MLENKDNEGRGRKEILDEEDFQVSGQKGCGVAARARETHHPLIRGCWLQVWPVSHYGGPGRPGK